jgi:hypothetical protein
VEFVRLLGRGSSPISESLKATLAFLEILTLPPMELTADDARAVLHAGVGVEALMDAIAVGALFSVVTRYADALDFAVPTANEFDRAAACFSSEGMHRDWPMLHVYPRALRYARGPFKKSASRLQCLSLLAYAMQWA